MGRAICCASGARYPADDLQPPGRSRNGNHMRLTCLRPFVVLLACLLAPMFASAEDIKIATWNVGNFHQHFAPTSQPIQDRELARWVREHGDRDNWVAAQVIKDPGFNPDVLVIC